MLALDFVKPITERSRKFWLAAMIVPSKLNSITACDLPIAVACAIAFAAADLLRHCNIGGSF